MANTAFLSRNRTALATVQTAAPPASDPASGFRPAPGVVGELRQGFDDAMRGRVSLIFLEAVMVALIGFYLWTRRAQGGG